MNVVCELFFFLFKQMSAYEVRISGWSSDVCSSDLATVSDMGPLLLARMLELNDTQEGVLSLVFKVADDEGQLLLDMKDLRAMLQNVADRSAELRKRYGNVSSDRKSTRLNSSH